LTPTCPHGQPEGQGLSFCVFSAADSAKPISLALCEVLHGGKLLPIGRSALVFSIIFSQGTYWELVKTNDKNSIAYHTNLTPALPETNVHNFNKVVMKWRNTTHFCAIHQSDFLLIYNL